MPELKQEPEPFITAANFHLVKPAFGDQPIYAICNRLFDAAVFKAPFGVWSFVVNTFVQLNGHGDLKTETIIAGHHDWTVDDARNAAVGHINAWLLSKNIDREAFLKL